MKIQFHFLWIIFILSSCSNPNGLIFKTQSTLPISDSDTKDSIIIKAAHVIPTQNQYEALKNEYIAFIHFGPNTFTRMEWGNGMEDPAIFNLQNLDTDQWCEAMQASGMKMVILTAKHHDGFCLWQSRYTKHGVMSSPYKNGKGDIVKELSESCKKYGLKLGIYLSPADLFQIENAEGLYGNLSEYSERIIPRPVEGRTFENKTTFKFKVDDYNEYFLNQLFELLTEYGPIHEVWFDGAHPKRKGGQTYNYLAWKELIHTLAPEAVIFGKQDIRWCGNESGRTRNTEWNVIPYPENPDEMNSFPDLTLADLGSREKLLEGKYLRYQPAETNTSIREGWFYRDEHDQKVRSADDVFDIYERSVGGNSIFLLNIPPNREGKFSPEDVSVLREVGKRIEETYGNNLFAGAKGPKKILDNDTQTFKVLNDGNNSIEISVPEPVNINRFLIQEAVSTHGERIEKFALDAWINEEWKEISFATNVGYKRILRFQEVTSKSFRIRILESRFTPVISNISAHYYKPRPPQLEITRNNEGFISIQAKRDAFGWKPHGENIAENLNAGMEIRFTKNGQEPNLDSDIYKEPFKAELLEVKAIAFNKNEKGSVVSKQVGIFKNQWKLKQASSNFSKYSAEHAFDSNEQTYWSSEENTSGQHFISIDLGENQVLNGFIYTPQTENRKGKIEKGNLSFSQNGKTWLNVMEFEFGNLINDPSPRKFNFKTSIETRFVKIESQVIAGEGKSASIAEIDFF